MWLRNGYDTRPLPSPLLSAECPTFTFPYQDTDSMIKSLWEVWVCLIAHDSPVALNSLGLWFSSQMSAISTSLVFLGISTPIGSSFIVNRLHMYSILPTTPFHLHTSTLGRQLSALTVSGHAKISNLQYLTLLSMSRTSSVCRSDFSLNRDSRCTKISVHGSLSFYQYLKLRLSVGHALAWNATVAVPYQDHNLYV